MTPVLHSSISSSFILQKKTYILDFLLNPDGVRKVSIVEDAVSSMHGVVFSGHRDHRFALDQESPLKPMIDMGFYGMAFLEFRGCQGDPVGDQAPWRKDPNSTFRVHDVILFRLFQEDDLWVALSDEGLDWLFEMEGNLRQGNDRWGGHALFDSVKGHLADADLPCQSFQRKPNTVPLVPDLAPYSLKDLALLV